MKTISLNILLIIHFEYNIYYARVICGPRPMCCSICAVHPFNVINGVECYEHPYKGLVLRNLRSLHVVTKRVNPVVV